MTLQTALEKSEALGVPVTSVRLSQGVQVMLMKAEDDPLRTRPDGYAGGP